MMDVLQTSLTGFFPSSEAQSIGVTHQCSSLPRHCASCGGSKLSSEGYFKSYQLWLTSARQMELPPCSPHVYVPFSLPSILPPSLLPPSSPPASRPLQDTLILANTSTHRDTHTYTVSLALCLSSPLCLKCTFVLPSVWDINNPSM